MENCGSFCCLGAATLYFLSRETGSIVEFFKSITKVHQLKDLAQFLEAESTVLPSMIALSGRVGSETPIKCAHSGILGVIIEETAEQHFLKRNSKFSWVQDSALMLPMTKEVPWYLEDGTCHVNVVGAQGAIDLALTVANEVFEKSEPSSLVRGTLDYLRGFKMLGMRRVQRVLPNGTELTVVGQAIKDGIGDVRIQKPEQMPLFVVPTILFDQVIPFLGKWSRRFKIASIGLALLGVILISKPAIEYIILRTGDILERRRQRLLLRRFLDAAAKREERVTGGLERRQENSSDGTSRNGDEPDLCVICLDRKYNAAFVPCGHMCCCITCSSRLKWKPCPLCRKLVRQILKIYRH